MDRNLPWGHDLQAALEGISRSTILLVATDFDGTLAPIVADPAKAMAMAGSMIAIGLLARMPHTHVAVISGRSRADLSARLGETDGIHLVGSHGGEFEEGLIKPPAPIDAQMLGRIIAMARRISQKTPGTLVEIKPAGVALHYRNAAEKEGQAAAGQFLGAMEMEAGVFVRRGKMVVEVSVVRADKGEALQRLRGRLAATAVLFLGDDLTDEDAFGMLRRGDAGVKVGLGETAARFRILDPSGVGRLLAEVAEKRATWLAGGNVPTIQ